MECANTLAMHSYHTSQERDETELAQATSHFRDASVFLQAMFSAINRVLADHPDMAEHVDEVDLRANVELCLMEGPLETYLAKRLRDWPDFTLSDVLQYDATK